MNSVLIRRKGKDTPWQPFAKTPERYAALFIATGLKAREIWDVKTIKSTDDGTPQYSVNIIEAGEITPFAYTGNTEYARIIRHQLFEDDMNLRTMIYDEVGGRIWKSE